MRPNDLNSKVNSLVFDSIIDDIETELEDLSSRTIPSGGNKGQVLKKNQYGDTVWSDPTLFGVAFSSEDGDVTLPGSDNIKSEVFPGGGEISIQH